MGLNISEGREILKFLVSQYLSRVRVRHYLSQGSLQWPEVLNDRNQLHLNKSINADRRVS